MTRIGRTAVATTISALVMALPAPRPAAAADVAETAPVNWPQFRGPDGIPVSSHPDLPTRWSRTENVEWVAEVPGVGWSSPIVWGGRVFVTSASSEATMKGPSLGVDFSNDYVAELMAEGKSEEEVEALVTARDMELPDEVTLSYRLLCYELESGELLWEREFHQGPPPVGRHRKNSYTSETPVTDGERVYVYVGQLGLFAFDMEGKPLWMTPLEAHKIYFDFGTGASAALGEGRLFVLNDNEDGSFIAGFDAATGEQLWYTERPGLGSERSKSGWSTPFFWRNELRAEVVTAGPRVTISYDVDGNELWRMDRMSPSAVQTPFAWEGHVYVASGSTRGDLRPLVAIEQGATGDITIPEDAEGGEHVLWWDRTAGGTYLPTPVLYDGALYVLTDKGILAKHDARTGKKIYRARIPKALNFTASPWAHSGHVFCINEEGDTFVLGTGDELELIATNSLEEFTMATPALSGDRLLIRTQQRLYSIRKTEQSSGAD